VTGAADGQEREIRIVHASDIHVDDDYFAAQFAGDGVGPLRVVVAAASRLRADLLLLVGDTFDHNRLPARVVEAAADALAVFRGRTVALPGNHDPATVDSPFRSPAFRRLERFGALGVEMGESLLLPELGLELWGRPHRDYGNMAPLAAAPPRGAGRRVILAHGHYEPRPEALGALRPSWLIGDAELARLDADYVALGHWNRAVAVGPGPAPAWYCGSPDVAATVNFVRLGSGPARVSREPLQPGAAYSASG
jgi:DNA repair exonuclease SbcCD nuclease subunit